MFYGIGTTNIALYGFDIHYQTTTGSGGNALRWQGCQDVQISDMDIVGFWNGMLVDSSGDVIYNRGTLEAADVPNGGNPRYGVMCAAISAGNANQTACASMGVNNRGANAQTVDAFVMTLGYNTLTLLDCGAESCDHAVWTKNDGGATPNFFVAVNFTAEGCGSAFQFDDGGVTQILGGLITTSGWGVFIGPNFSTAFPGVPVTISGLDFTSTAGGYVIQGNATVSIIGGHLNSISGSVPFGIPSDGINLASTSTSARVTMSGVQMNGVFYGVHCTSTWTGAFVGTGLLIQFVSVGVQWDSGFTGLCILAGGEVSNASSNTFIDAAGAGGLPANAHLGSSVIGVVGINPIGPSVPQDAAPASGTVYTNKTGFPLQVILEANASGTTTVSIAGRGPYTVPHSSVTTWGFPPNGTITIVWADAAAWDWAPA